MISRSHLVLAAILSGVSMASSGAAQPADASLRLELNKLEQADESCRTWLLLENAGPARDKLTLDLVVFDTDGVILSRLAVEAGPLREDKTVVKAFPLRGAQCDMIGRILLNDVAACGVDGDCMSDLATSSRTTAEFVK